MGTLIWVILILLILLIFFKIASVFIKILLLGIIIFIIYKAVRSLI